MVQGYERRETGQDPNAQKARAPGQADTIPVPGISGVRGADFSKLGANNSALADVIGSTSGLVQKFMEKQQDSARMEGKLAYTQGETEKEARAKGEAHHQGWVAYHAATAGETMYQAALADIQGKDAGVSPDVYRAQLSAKFKELSTQVGDDAYGRQLMLAITDDKFPRLMAEKVKTFNAFNKQENESSLAGLIDARAKSIDPNHPEDTYKGIQELMQNATIGMNKQDVGALAEKVIDLGHAQGNDIAYQALLGNNTEMRSAMDSVSQITPGLSNAILKVESGNAHTDKTGALTKGPDVKTIDGRIDNAWGRWQVMGDTLNKPGFGITPAKDRSPEEVERVGKAYFEAMSTRYDGNPILTSLAYHGGFGKLDGYLRGSDTQAKIGDPRKGEISWGAFIDAYQGPNSKEYTKKVIMALGENQPVAAQERSKGMESLITRGGLTVEQATRIANSHNTFVKAQQGKYEITNAIATNTLNTLSGEQLTKALTAVQDSITLDVQKAAQADPSYTQERASSEVRSRYVQVLVKNNVVDPKMKDAISSGLAPANIVDKDGNVNKAAAATFAMYTEMRKAAPPSYSDQYLSPENKRMVYNALSFDHGNAGSSDALRTAAAIEDQYVKNPNTITSVDTSTMPDLIDKELDKLEYDIWDRFLPHSWTNQTSTWRNKMTDSELGRIKTDPTFKFAVEQSALDYGRRGYEGAAAVKAGFADVSKKTEIVLGNVVMTNGATIRTDMGIPNFDKYNVVHDAMVEYLKTVGPTKRGWGSAYEPFQGVEDVANGISGLLRGVPNDAIRVTYNSARKHFLVTLLQKNEQNPLTKLIGMPDTYDSVIPAAAGGTSIVIPAAELGLVAKELAKQRDLDVTGAVPGAMEASQY